MNERLEEIKQYLKHFHNAVDVEEYIKAYIFNTLKVEWLIEQAERVQELEGERDEWRDTSQSYYMTNQELRGQNKRYREAIEKIKKKISKQLEGLDAEEEMQRVMELSELMTMAVGSLKEESFNLTQTTEQLDLFGKESE
ncbi:MAG TPA: hypothetical protein VLA13_04700 [Massilibacterium sp.]|nr:hypothetical protein [Massilibacterium sp.]